jgi:hypothetical protein
MLYDWQKILILGNKWIQEAMAIFNKLKENIFLLA